MATTAIWPIRGRMDRLIAYVQNPEKSVNPEWDMGLERTLEYAAASGKTAHQFYVSGVNCDPATAKESMTLTKRQFGKMGGIVAFHGYQSFAPGEVTPDRAHAIGVELAQRLWGERFEVVVSTHLNTGILHNHFLLNSISFVDGKRYLDNKTTYAAIRRASDELCKEHGLSVIMQENGRSQHYTEWLADHAGERTWRSSIREDVDRAVARSMTWNAFLHSLRAEGYEIKTGVKHIAIRPPGKERFVRLRSLGDAYTEEAIRNRILRQQRPTLPRTHPSQPRRVKVYGDFRLHKITWKGLRALYYHYLAMIRKARRQQSPAPFLFREDVRHLQALSEQAQFLHRYGIETAEQLSLHRANCDGHIILLCMERKRLKNELRREGTGPERREEIAARIIAINERLKELRKEVRLCDDILIRSVQIREKLRKSKEKEVLTHEPDGRSGRTGREHGDQRDRERR